MAEAKAKEGESLKVNEEKWSKPLMDAGWTVVPNVLIERQAALGLDPYDVNIIMHLAAYWWNAGSRPSPSKVTIAKAMNVDPSTVRRRIARLEAAGFLKRQQRRIPGKGSKTNVYHLDGLIKAALPFAAEKVQKRAADAEEQKDRVKRKRPELRIVSSSDDD